MWRPICSYAVQQSYESLLHCFFVLLQIQQCAGLEHLAITQQQLLISTLGIESSGDQTGSGGHRYRFKPFMPNVISNLYQLDESISIFRIVGWYFSFYSSFKRNFCKQTVENLTRCHVLLRLIWFCTVCRYPTKKTQGLYGLIIIIWAYLVWERESIIYLVFGILRLVRQLLFYTVLSRLF